MSRCFALGLFLALLAAPAASAADKPVRADGPTLMVRLQSVNHLLDYAEYIADLAGVEEVKQLIPVGRLLAGGDTGIEGVDPKRPFAFYADVLGTIADSSAVVMVPILDQDAVLGLLQGRLGFKFKEEKGLYTLVTSKEGVGDLIANLPESVYFRFAHKYLYITAKNKAILDEKKLPLPSDVVGKGESFLSVGFRIDRLPEEMKKFALGGLETAVALAKEQPLPNETDALKAIKGKAIDSLVGSVKSILFDGKEITLKIDIQPKKDEFALEFEMTAQEGSGLAKDLAELKSKKSVAFGSLASNKAAMLLALNLSLPESVKKLIGPAIDEAIKSALGMAPGDVQELIQPLVKAVLPTLKAGDLDFGYLLQGPDAQNHYTLVMAGKLAGGKDIEKALKNLVQQIPEPIRTAFELDADTFGTHKLHTLKVKDLLPSDVKKIVGESDPWLAFRDDALILAFGPDAKPALKEALGKGPASGPIAKVEFSVPRLLALAEIQNLNSGQKLAKEIFGKEAAGDTLSFTLEGGDGFRVRAAVKGKVIKFFARMNQAK